jgi:hypothetical protein
LDAERRAFSRGPARQSSRRVRDETLGRRFRPFPAFHDGLSAFFHSARAKPRLGGQSPFSSFIERSAILSHTVPPKIASAVLARVISLNPYFFNGYIRFRAISL